MQRLLAKIYEDDVRCPLKDREILTGKKLSQLEINGIRLSKFKNGEIGIDFIWIDVDNPPVDAIGWVAKSSSST